MTRFEDVIRALTVPRKGYYPRPWMTDDDPNKVDVLIVGASSAKTFLAQDVGNHQQFLDALWNRKGQTCRAIYKTATASPSQTRPNLDRLSKMLAERGLTSLQTNVTCASAPYDSEISKDDRSHGTELFKAVAEFLPWKAMIVYGVGASKRLGQAFGVDMPAVPPPSSAPVKTHILGRSVFVAPTLAAPAYRSSVWPYLERVVAKIVNGKEQDATLPLRSMVTRHSQVNHPREKIAFPEVTETPQAFRSTASNQLVWQRMHTIRKRSGLELDVSAKQASLVHGPLFHGTDRVFRHRFDGANAEVLVRKDIFLFDTALSEAADWASHKNPIFQRLRTQDIQLLGLILDAVEAFSVARAP